MSTTPTEAHLKLAVKIGRIWQRGVLVEAAQLLADSEARAVEAANKRLGAQMNYVVALQRAIEYHAQGLEIPVAIGSDCPHHASMLNAALTALRERVRVLEEALESLAYWSRNNRETRHTLRDRIVAALTATSEHAKEGSK